MSTSPKRRARAVDVLGAGVSALRAANVLFASALSDDEIET